MISTNDTRPEPPLSVEDRAILATARIITATRRLDRAIGAAVDLLAGQSLDDTDKALGLATLEAVLGVLADREGLSDASRQVLAGDRRALARSLVEARSRSRSDGEPRPVDDA